MDEMIPCSLTLQTWIESIPTAALAVKSDGFLMAINRVASEMGFRLNRSFTEMELFIHPALVEASLMQCFDSHERIVIQANTEDNREFEITFTPLIQESLPEFCIVIFTPSRKSSDTLERLEAGHKFITMGRLSAGILHEIRSPVQYIGDNIRFVREAVTDIVQFMQTVRDIVSREKAGHIGRQYDKAASESDIDYLLSEIQPALGESQDGIRQVRNILDAMKKFSHPGYEKKEMVNLNESIESALTITHSEWKNVAEMQTSLDPALPRIPLFGDEMNQALLNLIVNATHAVRDKKYETGEMGTITITTKYRDREVVLWISDTGTGIPGSIISKIFQPFYTTKKPGEGTGQGLTMVHSIVVEKHGGTISVNSEPGAGAVFEIHLPVYDIDEIQDVKENTYP